eukprot:6871665-Prymnesium_polylepis.1
MKSASAVTTSLDSREVSLRRSHVIGGREPPELVNAGVPPPLHSRGPLHSPSRKKSSRDSRER